MGPTQFLKTTEGVIAYDRCGVGKDLILCVPGMGDLRTEYRFLVPQLAAAGYTVVTMDLRGHGESSTSFQDFSPLAIGTDIVALLTELKVSSAVVIGTSMAAAAAVWAAAEAPMRISSLVLIGPFVRDVKITVAQRVLLKLMMMRPWGPAAWSVFYKTLYPTTPPADLALHRSLLKRNLQEAGRFEALQRMLNASKGPCEARIDQVKARTLIVMGTRDPDFPNPQAEARAVADQLAGALLLVPGAGHYPHAEQPDLVGQHLLSFLAHG